MPPLARDSSPIIVYVYLLLLYEISAPIEGEKPELVRMLCRRAHTCVHFISMQVTTSRCATKIINRTYHTSQTNQIPISIPTVSKSFGSKCIPDFNYLHDLLCRPYLPGGICTARLLSMFAVWGLHDMCGACTIPGLVRTWYIIITTNIGSNRSAAREIVRSPSVRYGYPSRHLPGTNYDYRQWMCRTWMGTNSQHIRVRVVYPYSLMRRVLFGTKRRTKAPKKNQRKVCFGRYDLVSIFVNLTRVYKYCVVSKDCRACTNTCRLLDACSLT